MDIGDEKRGSRRGAARAAKTPAAAAEDGQTPLNVRVFRGLRALIDQAVLPKGFVLLEGPVAAYFGVSRVPVRKAFLDLAAGGMVRKFRGRGYLVDPDQEKPEPLRLPLRSLDLPSRPANDFVRQRKYEWQRVYEDVAGEIARCLLFGTYQIREAGLCERYGISRTVVREVLGRLMMRGIIDKDPRSHWICGPFTARANDEQYRMRMILEPAALKEVADSAALPDIGAMIARLDEVRLRPGAPSAAQIAELDHDMHSALFENCTNTRLKAAIVQNQLSLNINRTFYTHFGVDAGEPMLEEHRNVLTALHAGRTGAGLKALNVHLMAARERSRARLKVLAVIEEPALPEFLERTH